MPQPANLCTCALLACSSGPRLVTSAREGVRPAKVGAAGGAAPRHQHQHREDQQHRHGHDGRHAALPACRGVGEGGGAGGKVSSAPAPPIALFYLPVRRRLRSPRAHPAAPCDAELLWRRRRVDRHCPAAHGRQLALAGGDARPRGGRAGGGGGGQLRRGRRRRIHCRRRRMPCRAGASVPPAGPPPPRQQGGQSDSARGGAAAAVRQGASRGVRGPGRGEPSAAASPRTRPPPPSQVLQQAVCSVAPGGTSGAGSSAALASVTEVRVTNDLQVCGWHAARENGVVR